MRCEYIAKQQYNSQTLAVVDHVHSIRHARRQYLLTGRTEKLSFPVSPWRTDQSRRCRVGEWSPTSAVTSMRTWTVAWFQFRKANSTHRSPSVVRSSYIINLRSMGANFLCMRCINAWNYLSEEARSSTSVYAFKKRLFNCNLTTFLSVL